MSASLLSHPPAPKPHTLTIQDLTVSYLTRGLELKVVSDVSLAIAPGEAYGLVGESGCGKTTVAMAVMRYLAPNARVDSGRILFQGSDLLAVSEAQLRKVRGNKMAMVYQDPGSSLNPTLTVGRQIAEVYRFHRGMGKAEALDAAGEMLRTVQISDPTRILGRYPHELSGGQQQRIMFAMALATDPSLLVLDEPTTGLDTTVEAEVLELVSQLRAEFDTAILFISHNLGIVARMCERVGVLYAGRLIEEGPSRQLFSDPRHPYTLGLLRCVPQPGTSKNQRRLESIPGALPPLGLDTQGCAYFARCALRRPQCATEEPASLASGPGRTSRCFYHDEVPGLPPSAGASVPSRGQIGSDPLLSIDRLGKSYGASGAKIVAISGVTLEVRAGEVLGLVGESGSGKSSLAKCVAGLTEISSGRIRFDGEALVRPKDWERRELRQKLQMVFQNPDTALNPSHTVRRILRRAAKLLSPGGTAADLDARIETLASAVRLRPQHLDLQPSALSGGLKQRVAIARAFAGSPAMVLCDEPTSALDVSVQAAILNLLADLQAGQHVTYLFISHDLGVVRYLADRIAVMYLGQIVEIGKASVVFKPPHHPYTEALLSAMPAIDSGAVPTRIRLTGTVPSPANPPSGCRFHTRCPRLLGEPCRSQEPPWQTDQDGHLYRCHIPPSDLRQLQASPPQPHQV